MYQHDKGTPHRSNVMTGACSLLLGLLPLLSLSCADDSTESTSRLALQEDTAIPDTMVRTPLGIVDRSCVHEVPSGSEVDEDGRVVLNGRVVAQYARCATPADQRTRKTVGAQPPTTSGWMEWTWANAQTIGGLSYYSSFESTWRVPPVPFPNSSLQYYFPSIQSPTEILQPVLQYGNNGYFSGVAWMLASWWVDSNNNYFYSTPIAVSAGDEIFGQILIVQPAVVFFAPRYRIVSRDNTNGMSSTLTVNIRGPFNTIQGGVLETYGLISCTYYPNHGTPMSIQFYNERVTQAGPNWNSFNVVTPAWTDNITGSPSPYCNYAVLHTGNSTTLTF